MGLFQRIGAAIREATVYTEVSLQNDELLKWLGIDPDSRKIQEVTYITCLKILSETMGKMPIKYYQETPGGKIRAARKNYGCSRHATYL